MNFQGMLGEEKLPSVGSVFCYQALAASSVPLSSTSPNGECGGEGCEKGGLRN